MTHIKLKIKRKENNCMSITNTIAWKNLYIFVLIGLLTACSDFVTIDLPSTQLNSDVVFEDPATSEAVLRTIYGKMRTNGLLSGGGSGLNVLMGLYTDELDSYRSPALPEFAYKNHTLQASDFYSETLWKEAYNQIYEANALIEGVVNSENLNLEDINQFKGEALFVRAYLHLLLVELYGDIPYITNTDYLVNRSVVRMSKTLVYENIITDLDLAIELLPEDDISEDRSRTRPYVAVAEAVLARAYLYTEQWASAEVVSTNVIDKFGVLEPDLNTIFLKGASGTIWQFKPSGEGANSDGAVFIFNFAPPYEFALNDAFGNILGNVFETGDQRKLNWVRGVNNFNNTGTWYHAFKYKEQHPTGTTSMEYSVQLRLAEQYLIRAEARVNQGDISGAEEDINVIRNRAGLGNTAANTLDTILNAILQERRVEFFTEKGHRWFDLKRMGKAKEVLSPIKPGWRDTDLLLPIPERELLNNPNLSQNDGY